MCRPSAGRNACPEHFVLAASVVVDVVDAAEGEDVVDSGAVVAVEDDHLGSS